jgi:ribosomal protein S27E
MSWYYTSNGKEFGPSSATEVRFHISSGSILPTDKVKGPGMAEWVPAADVLEQLGAPPIPTHPKHINENGEVQCIACGSTQVHSGSRGNSFWRGGIFGSAQVVITCLKCGQKFRPGGEPY